MKERRMVWRRLGKHENIGGGYAYSATVWGARAPGGTMLESDVPAHEPRPEASPEEYFEGGGGNT